MRLVWFLAVLLGWSLFPGKGLLAEEEAAKLFRERIQPMLKENCYRCHGPEKDPPESNLRLDSREQMLKGGDQGPAVVPGEPEKSLMWQAIRYEMDDLKMPPDRRLDDDLIEDVARWIRGGAPFPKEK